MPISYVATVNVIKTATIVRSFRCEVNAHRLKDDFLASPYTIFVKKRPVTFSQNNLHLSVYQTEGIKREKSGP